MVNVNLTDILSISQFQDRVSAKERVGINCDLKKIPMAKTKTDRSPKQSDRYLSKREKLVLV